MFLDTRTRKTKNISIKENRATILDILKTDFCQNFENFMLRVIPLMKGSRISNRFNKFFFGILRKGLIIYGLAPHLPFDPYV